MLLQLMLTLALTVGASGTGQERNLPTGVYENHGKYESLIYAVGKKHYLGTYESFSEAEETFNAALAAKKEGTFPEFRSVGLTERPQKSFRFVPL